MDNTRLMFVFYLVALFGLLVLVVYFINNRTR
jgi:hypothetical protein